MNRIDQLFREKKQNILSIYFTAGHPLLNSVAAIIKTLASEGVDMIEIGMPFSDPIADGPVIQKSSHRALINGMSVKNLFEQLKDIRKEVNIPLILMGYLNPVIQYGVEKFSDKCKETGIDGLILPDLPLDIYLEEYKTIFESRGLYNIFLITPQTSNNRILQIDNTSAGFLYMVAASSTTGMRKDFEKYQQDYFERVKNLNLKTPRIIGFGISDHATFAQACLHASGAIIGSAFVNTLEKNKETETAIRGFVRSIRQA